MLTLVVQYLLEHGYDIAFLIQLSQHTLLSPQNNPDNDPIMQLWLKHNPFNTKQEHKTSLASLQTKKTFC